MGLFILRVDAFRAHAGTHVVEVATILPLM